MAVCKTQAAELVCTCLISGTTLFRFSYKRKKTKGKAYGLSFVRTCKQAVHIV